MGTLLRNVLSCFVTLSTGISGGKSTPDAAQNGNPYDVRVTCQVIYVFHSIHQDIWFLLYRPWIVLA